MGVTGSGKTTIGRFLAGQTGGLFADADDYHPAANKWKMISGVPLNDMDRRPWLEALNHMLREWTSRGVSGVLACSALKATYRAMLVSGLPDRPLYFVFLDTPRETIAERLANRQHEYMNPALLDSQINIFEPPCDAIRVVNDGSPEEVTARMLKRIKPPPQHRFDA